LSQTRRVRRLARLAAFAWFSSPAGAGAQEPVEEAIRFQYAAAAACPSVDEFTERVRQRTARMRLAATDELARTFAVKVAAELGGFAGSVEFLDEAGSPVSRRVRGQQCDEVVTSLALITALALESRLEPEPEAPPAPERLAESAPAPQPLPPQPKPRESRWERDSGRGPSARVGASGGYAVPLEAFALGLLGQLDWARGSSPIAALRLRAHYAEGEHEVGGRYANLRLLGLEASVCPQALRIESFALYGCAAFDLGSLRARGVQSPELPFPGSSTILWVAVGAELRLAWQPDAPFWLELNGQLGTPLVKHTFMFRAPSAEAFRVEPELALGAGIVSGVRFF
jgi:hypothetical protein